MLAKRQIGIRFYEVIVPHWKGGNIRGSSHRCVRSSCGTGTSHSHCQHADREDRTEDSIRFKPAIEFVLFFARHAPIPDLICHGSFPLQPRRIYKRPGTRRANSFDDQRESAGQIVAPSYWPNAHLLCHR